MHNIGQRSLEAFDILSGSRSWFNLDINTFGTFVTAHCMQATAMCGCPARYDELKGARQEKSPTPEAQAVLVDSG